MKRISSVILSILVGALAVAVGMGIYLQKANQDRLRLEQVANEAQEKSKTALDQGQKAIQEANDKLKAANDEVIKAQEALKAIEDEREQLAKADALVEPVSKSLKGWQETVSLPQGLTMKYPPTSVVEYNDEKALTFATKPKLPDFGYATSDARWLSITPYDMRLENELTATVASSTPVAYSVKGRLLTGIKGINLEKNSDLFVLRVQSMGKITHLIWGKNLIQKNGQDIVLQALSTLTFQK